MAVRFDASGDKYTRTTNLMSATAWTMMCWFYRAATPSAYAGVLSYEHTTTGYHVFYAGRTGALNNWVVTNGSADFDGSLMANSVWYHLAMTCSGTGAGALLGYVNGVLDITGNGNSYTPQRLSFADTKDSEPCNCRLAAIKVYGAVLTAAEIANEMRCYRPIRTANLNSWYPLADPAVANNVTDYSGGGNNLTAGGTLAVEDGPPIPWRVGRPRLFLPAAVVAAGVPWRPFLAYLDPHPAQYLE